MFSDSGPRPMPGGTHAPADSPGQVQLRPGGDRDRAIEIPSQIDGTAWPRASPRRIPMSRSRARPRCCAARPGPIRRRSPEGRPRGCRPRVASGNSFAIITGSADGSESSLRRISPATGRCAASSACPAATGGSALNDGPAFALEVARYLLGCGYGGADNRAAKAARRKERAGRISGRAMTHGVITSR